MDLRNIRQWDTGALEQLENALSQHIQTIDDVHGQISDIGELPGWEGQAADAARQRFVVTADELTDEAAALGAVRTVTGESRVAVLHIKNQLTDIETDAASDGLQVRDDATVVSVDTTTRTPEEAALREQRRVELQARAKALIAQAEDIANDAAAVLTRAAEGKIDDRGATDTRTAAAQGANDGHLTAPAPPTDTSPAAAKAYWEALPESQRREVITQHPEWVGNRDGIPSAVRHEANVNRIDSERQRLEDRRDKLKVDIDNHPFNGAFTNEDAELELVENKLHELDKIEQILKENPINPDAANDQGARLLLLDMESGAQGKAAIATGDPDNADHISVAVPGVNTTIDSLGGMVSEGKALQTETARQLEIAGKGGEKVATISWLGYEPPVTKGGLDDYVGGWSDAAQTDRANAAAPQLAQFFDGLDVASNKDDPHLTGLGHSYGSYTLARALQDPGTGQPVDDAVFYGSPGINASDEPDLGLRQGHGYVMRSADDPITIGDTTHTFGPDPVTTNLEQLSVGAGTTPDGVSREGAAGHSEYPRPSGEGPWNGKLRTSGYNMAVVIGGLPAEQLYR